MAFSGPLYEEQIQMLDLSFITVVHFQCRVDSLAPFVY